MKNSLQLKCADVFVHAHDFTAPICRLRNTAAVSIDYRTAGGASGSLAAGATVVLDLTSSTSEIEVRRTDLSATAVSVLIEFGLEPDEAFDLSTAAVATHDENAAAHGLGAGVRSATRRPRIGYRNTFESFAASGNDAWTWMAGYGTLSYDTVNVVSGLNVASGVLSPRSLKLTCDGVRTQNFTGMAFASPKDLSSSKNMGVRFYVPEESVSDLQYVAVRYFATSFTNNYCEQRIWQADSAPSGYGWHEVALHAAQGVSVAMNWGAVTGIYIYVYTKTASATPSITFDLLETFGDPPKPAIMLTWDDANSGQYNASQIMSALGLRGTFYVCKYAYGQKQIDGVGLTTGQLKSMHLAGHLIANHTANHDERWSAFADGGMDWTEDEAMAEVDEMTVWLRENGFTDGALTFATPYGGRSPALMQRLLQREVSSVRLTRVVQTQGKCSTIWRKPLLTVSQYDTQGLTAANYISDIDAGVAAGGLVCVLMHNIVSDTVGSGNYYFDVSDFVTVMQHIASLRDAGTVDVITPADLSQYMADD